MPYGHKIMKVSRDFWELSFNEILKLDFFNNYKSNETLHSNINLQSYRL